MAQQPKKDRPPLRAVSTGKKEAMDPEKKKTDGPIDEENVGASVQQIWELVRKSTDVIVALREENGILSNELASLRRSEMQLQDRIEDFLERIDTLERNVGDVGPMAKDTTTKQIDRLEDKLDRGMTDSSDGRNVTITITIRDDSPDGPRDRMDDDVRSIIDAASSAIKRRVGGA